MLGQVLVLNGDYQPLNITSLRRAVGLIVLGKAEILEESPDRRIGTATQVMAAPSVIKLGYFIRKPYIPVKLSRRALFARDKYLCQYCGSGERALTVDHVVPRSSGGGTSWENLVTACKRCNNLKGGRSLEQSGFHLKHPPTQPHFILPDSYTQLVSQEMDLRWRKYLEYYLPKQ